MNFATLLGRRDPPEVYANTDISSPGIAIAEDMPEPTGTRGVWEEEIPAWQQESIARRRQQSINRLPIALFMARTGTNLPVIFTTVPLLVQKPARAEPAEATVSVPRLIAQVRSSLSLQVTQLAEALGVERPTVYAWIKEQSEPRAQKRTRLKELYQLAKRWDELANEPLGKELTEVAPDGHTILDFLLQSEIPRALVVERFRAIARAKGSRQTVAPQGKKSLAQIAQEHGIDMTRVSEQNDQIDIVTGKRIALD
jgi:transcriptional regulator with XRE-family HTH domain